MADFRRHRAHARPGPGGKIGRAEIGSGDSVIMLDVDATVKKAVAARGTIEDPFGHRWHVSTHQEDVLPNEMGCGADRHDPARGVGAARR